MRFFTLSKKGDVISSVATQEWSSAIQRDAEMEAETGGTERRKGEAGACGCTGGEEADSPAVWGEEVDDFDTSDEDFGRCRLFGELWWIGVDGSELVRLDGSAFVNWVTSDTVLLAVDTRKVRYDINLLHDATESAWADGNHDRSSSVGSDGATYKTLGTIHGNASHNVLTKMLLFFGQ